MFVVEIKGGLCYYLYEKEYSGDCEYMLDQEGKKSKSTRNLGDFEILIRDPELAKIVKHVMEKVGNNRTVDTMISGDTPFGIPTNPQTSSKSRFELTDAPYICTLEILI